MGWMGGLVGLVVIADAVRGDEPTAAHTPYNLVDRRHGRVSTAITSNIGLSDWGRFLGDATLTVAILDRLAMHAIRIDIAGPSYRQHIAGRRAADRAAALCAALSPLVSVGTSATRTPDASDPPGDARNARTALA